MSEGADIIDDLQTAEKEIRAILDPIYAEVRHWEAELARVRKAQGVIFQARRSRGDRRLTSKDEG